MARCALVTGNLILFLATVACGIAFFGPFWLANVRPDETASGEGNGTYFIYRFIEQQKDETYERGLWAECGRRCQWFWENNSAIQKDLFLPLVWHLVAQILYFVGALLVLLSLVFSQAQLCCRRERASTIRTLSGVLLFSFCVQTAAVAVFGGGSWTRYHAKSALTLNVDWLSTTDVYFDWSFWTAVAGGALTLLAAVFYLVHDCFFDRRSK